MSEIGHCDSRDIAPGSGTGRRRDGANKTGTAVEAPCAERTRHCMPLSTLTDPSPTVYSLSPECTRNGLGWLLVDSREGNIQFKVKMPMGGSRMKGGRHSETRRQCGIVGMY
jgi:hypothetical protein